MSIIKICPTREKLFFFKLFVFIRSFENKTWREKKRSLLRVIEKSVEKFDNFLSLRWVAKFDLCLLKTSIELALRQTFFCLELRWCFSFYINLCLFISIVCLGNVFSRSLILSLCLPFSHSRILSLSFCVCLSYDVKLSQYYSFSLSLSLTNNYLLSHFLYQSLTLSLRHAPSHTFSLTFLPPLSSFKQFILSNSFNHSLLSLSSLSPLSLPSLVLSSWSRAVHPSDLKMISVRDDNLGARKEIFFANIRCCNNINGSNNKISCSCCYNSNSTSNHSISFRNISTNNNRGWGSFLSE